MKKPFTRLTRLLSVTIAALCFSTGLFAQQVNVSFKDTPIKTVLREVTRQTGYNFVYSDALTALDKRIDITYNAAAGSSIERLLDRIFEGTDVIYSITDKQVALLNKEIEQGSVQPRQTTAATRLQPLMGTVSGVVKNGSTDETLIGVVVNLKGTDVYITTDVNGAYSIMSPKDGVLTFSYLGMATSEIPVGARTAIDVFMEPDVITMSEVVVTGYASLPRERATGSYGTVSAVALETKLQPSLSTILEGQVAGLTIDRNNRLEVRGVGTINAAKEPLIVVDGFPIDPSMNDSFFRYNNGALENINADNIDNITVLKDGVAASIYGSRAANGVIVITTKKGRKGEAKFSYRGTFSITQKPNLDNLNKASTNDYIDAEIDLFNLNPSGINITTGTGVTSRVPYLLKQVQLGQITQAQADAEIAQLRNNNYLGQVEEYLYRPQITHQHNFNVNGGTDNHTYNVALNYMGTQQTFKYSNNDRFTIDIRDDWRFNKFISLGTSINFAHSTLESPYLNPNPNYSTSTLTTGGQTLFNYYTSSYFVPYAQIADKDGNALPLWGLSTYKQDTYKNYDGMKNTDYYFLDDINKDMSETTDFQTRITGVLKIDIAKGLNAEIGGNWQLGSYKYQRLRDAESFYVREAFNDSKSKSNSANHYLPDGAIVDERRSINKSWTFRGQINFNRNFGGDQSVPKHSLSAFAGMEVRHNVLDFNTIATRAGYDKVAGSFVPLNVLDYNSTVYGNDMLHGRRINMITGSYNFRDNRFVSWYGNASYMYDDRYIVTGSIRLDLTNFFGTDAKYRYKPLWSVGGTWKLSNESFFNVSWINRLHVRASYGINGNISLDQGPFLILGVGSFNSASQGIPYSISSPPNNQLRWEKTRTTNLGIDLTMFNNAIDLSIDYYDKLSSDVLAPEDIDRTTGFSSQTKNSAKILNRGVEITIGATPIRTQDFSWNIVHNFAYNYNVVKEYNSTLLYVGSYLRIGEGVIEEGYAANGIWGLKWAPLNETGNAMIWNKDGERILSSQAKLGDQIYLGSLRPKFDLSLTNRFTYKDWEFSFMFVAKLGHVYRKDAFQSRNIQNKHVGDRWKKPGDEAWAIYPALTHSNSDWWYAGYLDKHVGNASFAKLRDVTLTYNVDRNLMKKLGLSGAKVYVQGRNLFTIKHKDTDIDPESYLPHLGGGTTGSGDYSMSTLAVPREFIIGLQISF